MDELEYIKKPILRDLERFGQVFDQVLHHSNPMMETVFSHIRQRKGKLMRPTLLLLIAREFGEPSEASYLSAAMLELLHTASLVHDDIVDESGERRGQASVNALYGNKVAVLIGDYLLSSSLEKAAETHNLKIVNHIARLGKQLASGEIIQLSNTQNDLFSEESYFDVIRLKTASLFSVTAEVGAISVGAPDSVIPQMHKLGDLIGMCFQVRDDIFDYYDNSKIGKPTGNDMLEGKLTLPVLYSLRSHPDSEMIALARRIKQGGVDKNDIKRMVDFAIANGGIDYALSRMKKFSDEALQLVSSFKNPTIKSSLETYIEYVSRRTI